MGHNQGIQNITGTPVTGENFFGRGKEIKVAWKTLSIGNNLLIPSPRRIGKTSFAFKLLEIAEVNGWNILHLNVEKYDEAEFLTSFSKELLKISAFKEKLKAGGKELFETIARVKPKIKYEDAEVSYEIEGKKVDVYRELDDLIDHKKKTLIFIDELTILLGTIHQGEEGVQRVGKLLHWLRDLRIKKDSQVKWIFCSSVGLSNFTHALKLSETINDLDSFSLRALRYGQSIELFQLLAAGDGNVLNLEVVEAAVKKLKFCIPYFIQVLYSKMNRLHEIDGTDFSLEMVDSAYDQIIGENHFDTWIERIQKQYGDLRDSAFIILSDISQNPRSRTNISNRLMSTRTDYDEGIQVTSNLISMLVNDGYIMEEDGQYRFRSPLLRDFWHRKHVK